jgi:hypothetical protein
MSTDSLPATMGIEARAPGWQVLIPLALLLLFAGQCWWFMHTQSMTVDEPFHILAGQTAWRQGAFKDFDDNPPLVRLWFTLFVRDADWQIEKQHGSKVTAIHPEPQALLLRARTMNVVLGLALWGVLWVAARRLFSTGAANFALALYVLSPALIAHSSLATHDAPVALGIFGSAWLLVRWRQSPTWPRTLALGFALGAMLGTKHSAAPMFALAVALALILAPDAIRWNPLRWNWGRVAVVAMLALLVLWGSYFFHVSRVTLREGKLHATFPNFPWPLETSVPLRLNASFYVPAAEYLTGLANVAQNSSRGYETFLLGESYSGGRRSFFPLVMVLKWPTLVLLAAATGGLILLLRKSARPAGLGLLMLFPAAYFGLAVMSNMNFGDRHILPVYPFLLLLAAAAWQWATRKRLYAIALLALVGVQAADTARYAPDYLAYFNPFVDPAESYRVLTDSNLDWGQGLVALREYERAHPHETIHLAYWGNIIPAAYGLRAIPLQPGQRVTGTVIVSARHLSGHLHPEMFDYKWVLQHPRKAILAHVLHVFEVPPEAGSGEVKK